MSVACKFHSCDCSACPLTQEYKRCAHALRKVGGPRASFLRCYATYLLGEARKEEERLEAGGLLGNGQAVNKVPSHVIRAQDRGFGLLPGRPCSEACYSRQRLGTQYPTRP